MLPINLLKSDFNVSYKKNQNKTKQHKNKSQHCKKIPAKMFLRKLCEHSQLV